MDELKTAKPAHGFDNPPYRDELFSDRSGWAGVMNRDGINCLTFPNKPGAVVTSHENAKEIAERWNKEANLTQPRNYVA